MRYSHLSVAIPMLAELKSLPTLFQNLEQQRYRDFEVYFCVNSPAAWASSTNGLEREMHEENQETLRWLEDRKNSLNFRLCLLNRQWQGKQRGVGWARKVLFDTIADKHDGNELIVSLDADTLFLDNYLENVLEAMNGDPSCSAISVPYYHPLTGDENTDRAMLRYEVYMRHYLLSLKELGVHFPYAFTALGSAMVFPVWSYRRVGGITPLQGGEDFYLMQKFAKTGHILSPTLGGISKEASASLRMHTKTTTRCQTQGDIPVAPQGDITSDAPTSKTIIHNYPVVFPSARPSRRVPFGTGPAIASGLNHLDTAYPLYPNEAFNAVGETYKMFPLLYEHDMETPMSQFLRQQLRTTDVWGPLRKNFKSRELFIHACHERVDGLRILQFLKTFKPRQAEEELRLFCQHHRISLAPEFSFRQSTIADINTLRNRLFEESIQSTTGKNDRFR